MINGLSTQPFLDTPLPRLDSTAITHAKSTLSDTGCKTGYSLSFTALFTSTPHLLLLPLHDMHDLRRQALESGKTVSKKAKSRQVSGSNSKSASQNVSPEGSKVTSRVASRNVSDDEDNFSDETNFSTHSIDEMITSPDDMETQKDAWRAHLNIQIENILNRKRSSVEGREIALAVFSRILMLRFAQEEISNRLGELATAILKSATSGGSDTESILALKGLSSLQVLLSVY